VSNYQETTDSDETEFRPAKSARDGEDYAPDLIPDGFYLVGDKQQPRCVTCRSIWKQIDR